MTGAPIPSGVNAVLPQEEAEIRGGALLVPRRIRAGAHVRRTGEDCRRGRVLARSGTCLQPCSIAMLSAFGYTSVDVHRPPRIAILVTGDEVHSPARSVLPESGIYDTHTAFLTAALQELGLRPAMLATARDSAPAVKAKIRKALQRADVVLITGGVSVGERDVVRPVLNALGVQTLFWQVAQKPGKPLFFGRRGKSFLFGLPGNPASMIACYLEYVRPALRRMLGMAHCYPEAVRARLARPIAGGKDRTHFVRGRLTRRTQGWSVTTTRREASNLLTPFRGSDCLVVIPKARRSQPDRSRHVVVHPFPWRLK